MQTTITTHIADLEFGLKRTDSSHVISDEDDVCVFLPIGIEFELSIKDWLTISKYSDSQSFIRSFVTDKIRKLEIEEPIRIIVNHDIVILSLTETLELEISITNWKKVASKIVREIVSA